MRKLLNMPSDPSRWSYSREAIHRDRKVDFTGCQKVLLTVVPDGWKVENGRAVKLST